MRLWRILLNAQGAEGGTTTEKTAEKTADDDKGTKAPDRKAGAEGLIAKHGDATGAVVFLMGENYKEREKNRELTGKVPAADAVVLSGDQFKDWEQYRALGKPAEVKRTLSERDQFKTEADGFRKDVVFRQAAEIHGYKPGVLATLARDEEIVIGHLVNDREVPIDRAGKVLAKDAPPVPAAFVKSPGKAEGDKPTLTRLDLHAEAAWKDFLPSLAAETARPGGTPSTLKNNRFNPAAPRGGQSSNSQSEQGGAVRKSLVK